MNIILPNPTERSESLSWKLSDSEVIRHGSSLLTFVATGRSFMFWRGLHHGTSLIIREKCWIKEVFIYV